MVRRRDESPEGAFMIDNRYERISKLGEGTYGKVYKARDTVTNDIVALKKCRLQVRDVALPRPGGRRNASPKPPPASWPPAGASPVARRAARRARRIGPHLMHDARSWTPRACRRPPSARSRCSRSSSAAITSSSAGHSVRASTSRSVALAPIGLAELPPSYVAVAAPQHLVYGHGVVRKGEADVGKVVHPAASRRAAELMQGRGVRRAAGRRALVKPRCEPAA